MKRVILGFAVFAGAVLSADACSTIVVGKDASATGRVIVGHNEDDDMPNLAYGRLAIVPPRTHRSGAVMPAESGCAKIPQVAKTHGFYWSEVKDPAKGGLRNADLFVNDQGVFVTSDNAVADPPKDAFSDVVEGGIGYNLRRAIAERANSARDGVAIATNLLQRYGYDMPGRMYIVADAEEGWVIEVVHGRRYVARRCPDNAVTVLANCYTIGTILPDDVLAPSVAERVRAEPNFAFDRAYQGVPRWRQPVDLLRMKHMYRLAAGVSVPEGMPPFSVVPHRRVTVADVKAALSTHYEGTPDACLPRHARPWCDMTVCRPYTIESTVCAFGKDLRALTMHVSNGSPCENAYQTFCPYSGALPAAMDRSTDAIGRLESHVFPEAGERPLFILNEDNDHYFKKPASEMTREALNAYVDNFARGHVTHFFMCPSGQRASFDSKTVEPIWKGIEETAETTTATAADGTHDRWALNAKKLFDAGIDPYEVWTTRCRERGVSPWFTIRMNDVHGTTNFHRRDLWRNPAATSDFWHEGQFDYARRDAREYMLRHICEVAERWDMDGIELDWMRFGYCLAQGRERVDASILTDFIRTVRWRLDGIGKRRGKRIKLGCRVPRDPVSARAVGLKVGDWLDSHSIDLLVPHSFLAADIELPVDEWLTFVARHGGKVRVVPGIDIIAGDQTRCTYMTPALYRGCIEKFYARGAKGIYFFNLPYLDTTADVLYDEGIAPATISTKLREYLSPHRDFPFKGKPKNVPELMKTADGRRVTDRATWETVRRGEIREIFEREIYGRRPAEKPSRLAFSAAEPDRVMMQGKAIRKRIRVSYGDRCGDSSFVMTAFIPTTASAQKPAPAFLLICNRNPKNNIDPERNEKSGFWPAEQIVERGYAALAFFNGDVAQDYTWDFTNGVFGVFQPASERTRESWGILSAWAWGASRVMDWIENEPTLDAKHVAVVGHSRGGKTSLLAGVTDTRFAMACVNCSGCGGAKLNHMELPLSEHYDQLRDAISCWFCPNFEKYVYREHEIPFDTHEWAALMAPRLLAIASATGDDWAGQEGEFQTARLASPAWELYGMKGLVGETFPKADCPLQEGCISYHMRTGEHNLTPYDWARYMDFADAHGWKGRR